MAAEQLPSDEQLGDAWGKFTFIAEHPNGQRVSVELRGDSNLSDTIDAVETFLVAAGFSRDQVMEIFK